MRYFIACALGISLMGLPVAAQSLEEPQVNWKQFSLSVVVHGAASSLDAWSSWGRSERNPMLAENGRFGSRGAMVKACWFAGATGTQILVLKKWGTRHPWLARAFKVANLSVSVALAGAASYNLIRR